MLSIVELDPATYGRRFPRDLSGGEQQRIGVARALAADPVYLLMDEPFGALDAITRDVLQHELLWIKRELGKTIVFVTHDIFEALTLADRILARSGLRWFLMVSSGQIESPLAPAKTATSAFLGREP